MAIHSYIHSAAHETYGPDVLLTQLFLGVPSGVLVYREPKYGGVDTQKDPVSKTNISLRVLQAVHPSVLSHARGLRAKPAADICPHSRLTITITIRQPL